MRAANSSTEFNEWWEVLFGRQEPEVLLSLEQSCDGDGMLLPWDLRGVRLRTAPLDAVCVLHEQAIAGGAACK